MASTSTDIVSSSSSMASTSTDIVSSSSSSTSPQRYDVFLSFYGDDTRYRFTDHLHDALQRKGLFVFRDVEKLERGKYLSDELPKAIQQSKCGIAVISKNYAFSKWCLDELAEMVKCPGLRVFPIFYHVNPSDIRKVRGTFAEAFDGHEKDPKVDIQMMSKWRAALREVSNMSGWHLRNDSDRYESNVIKEICNSISDGLRTSNFSFVSEEFVGIKPRVEEIMALLSIELDEVRFLGIWGMGGIGKTTLSKAIYEEVSHKFDASCFIEETRSLSLVDLQKHLISHILKEREIDICNPSKEIRSRLRTQKIFIILDDVDGEKLEALAKRHDWFGQGSRIIITSRDQHLLSEYVDKIYEVKVLNHAEALKLFSLKAFKKPHPEKKFEQLSEEIVNYANGLPLAINVFGKLSRGRELKKLESVRDLLRENPNAEILDRLKISYHELENSQQNLFLDIACFFNGEFKKEVIYKLEALGCYPNINLDVLVEKSLITISESGRLGMHDLLQKLGQKIVHDESAKLGKLPSRLWREEDVIRVLKNDSVSG
ncbi:TMV resistance protein N-like [Corylus avellana]|uniref:TMV resistance protein N-like n=1 Tax=Corylus avellana TaxID=13451 RepID=UPI00286B0927|nr:TMV resistance protein N-like [Corylus avellana]